MQLKALCALPEPIRAMRTFGEFIVVVGESKVWAVYSDGSIHEVDCQFGAPKFNLK